jgi:hypothetical protein
MRIFTKLAQSTIAVLVVTAGLWAQEPRRVDRGSSFLARSPAKCTQSIRMITAAWCGTNASATGQVSAASSEAGHRTVKTITCRFPM